MEDNMDSGDFITLMSKVQNLPHIIEGILLRMPAFDLEQCRLVSRTWRDYIDEKGLLKKVWEAPNGRLWTVKDRKITIRKVVSAPENKVIQDLHFDPTLTRAIVSNIDVHSKREFTSIHLDYLQKELPPNCPDYDAGKPTCSDNLTRYSRTLNGHNWIHTDNAQNCLFLKNCVVYVDQRERVCIHAYYGSSKHTLYPVETLHKIGPLGSNDPDGFVIYCCKKYENILIEHKIRNALDPTNWRTYIVRHIIPGPTDIGLGNNMDCKGLQIMNTIGIVLNGHGQLFIFKTPAGGEQDVMNLIEIDVKFEASFMDKNCLFKVHNHDEKMLVVTPLVMSGKPRAIRCFDVETGVELWSKYYQPKANDQSVHYKIVNVFSSGTKLYWTVYGIRTEQESNDYFVYCWDSKTPEIFSKLCIKSIVQIQSGLSMQDWLEIDNNSFIIPLITKGYGPQAIRTISLFVIENNNQIGLSIKKRFNFQVYTNTYINNRRYYDNHQRFKFFFDKESLNLYFCNLQAYWTRPSEGPEFNMYSLSLKKKGNGELILPDNSFILPSDDWDYEKTCQYKLHSADTVCLYVPTFDPSH